MVPCLCGLELLFFEYVFFHTKGDLIMFCTNCNKEINDDSLACIGCGLPPRKEKKFCNGCGAPTNLAQIICTKCGVSLTSTSGGSVKNKVTAGILALFLGGFGGHKFYLGYTKEAVIMLSVNLILVGLEGILGGAFVGLVALIEAIIYFTKSDEEFTSTYVDNKKGWF